ncbi:DNA polymerase subunit Cdc27 [Desarmillaria tabescens]|uniref:DNA polymerase delta subunit 3 n=1 Tax=Armillaria tabescens TaxID=1929756 RepID=A0AA39NK23_ARMTA|nr:DNA polymerase subunit Cdc27 [Desarmillaria tabescens]KAK0467124.1 DNA polymerase subunit Cdc27 [Desarmillaria tabescens]
MSSKAVGDFLTKQLLIEKNIVTYRSLSRELSVHVNVAKNELAAYYGKASMEAQDITATYVISGILKQETRHDEAMDVDTDEQDNVDSDGYDDDESEPVTECGFTVVGEGDLESAKMKYSQINAIHIYSLSPSPILDGGFLCVPTERLRQIDLEKGEEMAKTVGKVMGEDIPQASSSKDPKITKKAPAPPVAGPSKVKASNSFTETASKPKPSELQNKKVQPAKSGTLDWSKAKPKAAKEEPKDAKVETKPKQPLKPLMTTKADEKPVKKEETETLVKKAQPKRGTKRKSASALMSDSEDDSSSSRSKPAPKKESEVKLKGVVVSEDEEDEDDMPRIAARKPSRKVQKAAKQVDSEAERDLRAMMDVDDDQVIRASRHVEAVKKEEEEEEEEPSKEGDNVDMADEAVPAPKRKRKEKKVVPVGRNGLKKKRVVKSRESIDAKGYMVTEDYSSYESVDEEEEPPVAAKAKSKPSKVNKVDEDSDAPAPKPKPLARKGSKLAAPTRKVSNGKTGQQTMMSFFGKK